MGEYGEFLESKRIAVNPAGRKVDATEAHSLLYDFQRDIVLWALRVGRAAIFSTPGTGKTFMQLEFGRLAGGTCLIVAPLTVAEQTVDLAYRLDCEVNHVESASEIRPGLNITNYEMLHHFEDARLDCVVLDESSIIKSVDGKTRAWLLSHWRDVRFRLCCTATPCPNDISELANHAEFLGHMRRAEMLASFFVHDESGWRLRGHAKDAFYRWLSSWAMAMNSPTDLGYDGSRFVLPELRINEEVVTTDWRKPGELFPGKLSGITDRAAVRKQTVRERISRVVDVIKRVSGQVIAFCGLNDEAGLLAASLPDCVEISGADSRQEKHRKLLAFTGGKVKVLISKPKVAGFGLNLQCASTVVFVGLSDSWEAYYQCIRRAWRFGQKQPVDVIIVVTDHERDIVVNVKRKEVESSTMMRELIEAAKGYEHVELHHGLIRNEELIRETWKSDAWELRNGDSVEELATLADESIDLSVFSPPFASLYTYSPTERDLGNCRTNAEFFAHFRYVIRDLLRVTKSGRIAAVHVADVPAMLVRDGYIGLKDFSGDVIREFESAGWIFDARVPIDKNQQAQSIRTHAKGLTMTQMEKDRTWSRPALPDYVLKFRKPGENKVPVCGDFDRDLWIEWANPSWPNEHDRCAEFGAWPTWYGIQESDTLNAAEARSNDDDKHICPLQLPTIERVVRLWSNVGELVLSPFAGIGSEGYEAVRLRRRFWGCELKRRYAEVAVKNLRRAESKEDADMELFRRVAVSA